jgi:hypothetical protein
MRAERLHALRGILAEGRHKPFGPILFILSQADIHHIAGHGILDEDDLSFHPRNGFTFRRVVLHKDIGQFNDLISFSHGANILKMRFLKNKAVFPGAVPAT